MTVLGNLRTGTYTIRNATTSEFVAVQGPAKAATLVVSKDGRAENAAWILETLSGHHDKYNIRNFAQNSYATVNSVQKRNTALTCGREACPWSIRPTGYGTYVLVFHQGSFILSDRRASRISPHSDASLFWSIIASGDHSQALLTDDRTHTVHWYLHRVSA
ncbi:uncharacterized protein EDB91DRAFT_1122554 [Suillus paluster]|uniref:uncharacterized protein n=1 Tax=Suillus paluster TaxID=48578 RepID=UPI001B87C869|nr:uncharacterized protein EDB91DRAFT_1122554 [Suillus paluster]KAG1745112.1 hypothetical protein EDB91DRAFT_1122554 [Suillus paluster]